MMHGVVKCKKDAHLNQVLSRMINIVGKYAERRASHIYVNAGLLRRTFIIQYPVEMCFKCRHDAVGVFNNDDKIFSVYCSCVFSGNLFICLFFLLMRFYFYIIIFFVFISIFAYTTAFDKTHLKTLIETHRSSIRQTVTLQLIEKRKLLI